MGAEIEIEIEIETERARAWEYSSKLHRQRV
jgi:hypothetical protein